MVDVANSNGIKIKVSTSCLRDNGMANPHHIMHPKTGPSRIRIGQPNALHVFSSGTRIGELREYIDAALVERPSSLDLNSAFECYGNSRHAAKIRQNYVALLLKHE